MSHEHNSDLKLPIEVIPHRPPHLWLDGVTELEVGVSAKGFWTPGEEHFLGHFEGMPLLPGVDQIEALAQLGAYLAMVDSEKPQLVLFRGIEDAGFERSVKPEEVLDLAVEIIERDGRDFKGRGIAEVSGIVACRATIAGTLLPEKVARRMLGSSS